MQFPTFYDCGNRWQNIEQSCSFTVEVFRKLCAGGETGKSLERITGGIENGVVLEREGELRSEKMKEAPSLLRFGR